MGLSERLKTAALMVKYKNIADIGTDHGYVPCFLAENKIINHAIACDINKGPLLRAEENIRNSGLEDIIETRLGNGLDKIEGSEAETVIIAGMGGILICDILKKDTEKLNSIKQLVLQPQRDVYKVRKCLHSLGFKIDNEEMVFENGKYYNIISAVKGVETYESDADYIFGRRLIENKSQVLKAYINSRIKKYENILAKASFDKTSESLENINYLYKLSKEVVKNL